MLVFVCCSFCSSSSSSAAADGFSVDSFGGALASRSSLVSWEIFRFRFFMGVLVLELGIFCKFV